MLVYKKINNNVAVCKDGNNKDVVVFARGIGFKEMPYELTDMSTVERTFYGISKNYIGLVKDIDQEMFDISSTIVDYAVTKINSEFNPNLAFTLADHINFAVSRYKNNIHIKTPYVGDIKVLYEDEYKIGKAAVSFINKRLKIHLPKEEAISIALHIINAETMPDHGNDEIDVDVLTESVLGIIEDSLDIKIVREGFNCNRFITHLHYLIQRLKKGEALESNNAVMFEKLIESYPETYKCALLIGEYLQDKLKKSLSDEETMYLMMHINRMCSREKN